MRSRIIFLSLWLIAPLGYGAQGSNSKLTTNLVEILPYIRNFGRALDLDLPEPLTTNLVSRYTPYRGIGATAGIEIQKRWQFVFNVPNSFISGFTDREHAMVVLWRPEEIVPLLKPSKLTKDEAIALARKYLQRLGYSEESSPVLPPVVKPWNWEPVGTNHSEPLPFFTIEWPWKLVPDRRYFALEIDGLRERPNYFSTMYRSFAELSATNPTATNATPSEVPAKAPAKE